MNNIAVFADDLTGANASAGSLSRGLGVPVLVAERLPDNPQGPIVLNTRSREDTGRGVLITRWTRYLWAHGYRTFDKRIDTTLRGPAPRELRSLIEALPERPWVAVIAGYPLAGRTTVEGQQLIWNHPVHEVLSEVTTDIVSEYLFGAQVRTKCVSTASLKQDVALHAVDLAQNYHEAVFDVTSEADLKKISVLLNHVRVLYKGPVITVSSGAILEYYPCQQPIHIAIIVGSPTSTNVRQVNYIAQYSQAMIMPIDEPLRHQNLSSTIVMHSGLHAITAASRRNIIDHLADSACHRLEELGARDWVPHRIILTGGEMAQSFLDRTHADGVRIFSLLAPLVGQGIIEGGNYNGVEIVTKGGMIGADSLLFHLTLPPLISQTTLSTLSKEEFK